MSRSCNNLTNFKISYSLAPIESMIESMRARGCALTDFCGDVLVSAETVVPASRPKKSSFENGSDSACQMLALRPCVKAIGSQVPTMLSHTLNRNAYMIPHHGDGNL